jgi:uncharacterized phage-like protein YoqJ
MKEINQNMEKTVRIVCFTGHREIPDEAMERLPELLVRVLNELYTRGARVFRAGGAQGFDTVAALAVLDMKETYPEIELELVLPCQDQTEGWDMASVQIYHYIMQNADYCEFLFENYVEGCMQERDRALVDGSDVCVAYCARSQGGTAFTFAHAMQEGLEVINLYEMMEDLN